MALAWSSRSPSGVPTLGLLALVLSWACSEVAPKTEPDDDEPVGGAAATGGAAGGGGQAGAAGGKGGGAGGMGVGSGGLAGSPDAAAPERMDAAVPEPAAHAALVPGGYDRLVVARRDDARGLCFRVTLASPQYMGSVGVTVPDPWVAESVSVVPSTVACRGLPQAADGPVLASAATGRVSWPGMRPCRVTVDVKATFVPTDKVQAQETVAVDGVPVEGCP